MNTFKGNLVNLAIFLGLVYLITFVVPVDVNSFNAHGRGWALIILSCLIVSFLSNFVQGFIGGVFKTNLEIHPDVVYVCKVVLSWLAIGAGFILAAWMAPSLVTAATKPVLIFWSLFGFASGIADVATERLCFGSKRRS